YGLDVIALVSYDQVAHSAETTSSFLYWTIVGAYVVKGNKNDVQTFVDTAVFPTFSVGAADAGVNTGSGYVKITFVVVRATSTALSAPPTLRAGQTANITVTVTAAPDAVGEPSGQVSLYGGAMLIGSGATDANGVVTFQLTQLVVGTHTITAVFTPDAPADFAGSQDSATITVAAAQLPATGSSRGGSIALLAAWVLVLGVGLQRASRRSLSSRRL
ncbi:MAG: Ig-like domain repeat protein, partial [Ilumatobacteraceae bacterium]